MSDSQLSTEVSGHTLIIRMDRPESYNAITREMADGISDAIAELDNRDELRVGIITGSDRTFSAGMDLKQFAAGIRPVSGESGFAGIAQKPPAKPLIAAVEGYALGGGFEIVLACDLVVASRSAVFGCPEVKRGLTAGAGGMLRLPRFIPHRIAMELILTGRMCPATEAVSWGLVNRIAEDGFALEAASQLAVEVASGGPLAVRTSKKIMTETSTLTIDEAFEFQEDLVDAVRKSKDAAEGVEAFNVKRSPVWQGA